MAKALAFLLAVPLLGLFGCSCFGGPPTIFSCTDDSQCRSVGSSDGRCEITTMYCSFPKAGCSGDGYGYDEHAGGGLSNTCVTPGPDAQEIDAPDKPGDVCFGDGASFVKPCFAAAPSGAVVLPATIDTTTSTLCATGVSNTTACVIAGATVQVPVGTVAVTGTKPLVLVATDAITILGA